MDCGVGFCDGNEGVENNDKDVEDIDCYFGFV